MSAIVRTVPDDESEDEFGDSSSFSHLPDEMVLQILRELIDLKTLCVCKLVCKRFFRIAHQVRTISFTAPSNFNWKTSDGRASIWSAIESLNSFKMVKSLSIEVPSSCHEGVNKRCSLFKWKIIKFGNKLDSFVFLSPNSVYHNKESHDNENGHEQVVEEGDVRITKKKRNIALQCLSDAVRSHSMMLICIENIPSLEKVVMTDSDKRWRISVSGGKIAEMRNGLSSAAAITDQILLRFSCKVSNCYVPLLELPVSGYVLKGVTLFLCERDDLPEGNDGSVTINDINDNLVDKEEAAYSEAMMEIFKNHSGGMEGQDTFVAYYVI
ncbi:F-box domain, Leucine-rich repeat domain, L domain-like protein [Artemisia annua]|uniref:F-box domain, Leucine-rich repeat domain, L domain-like protein n=1 Tax=Artemisia annua TaxID=35608 RepID=A0A2U1LI00_ARTAN|nr:F-box domain, Leucine-rich repeat domain, L domain-like protein [Artemisia annua]